MTILKRLGAGWLGNLPAAALAVLTVACGGAGSSGLADMAALPPDLWGLDLKDTTYPAGPYAQSGNTAQGDVLPDFTFQGYWSPTDTAGLASKKQFGEVTLGMMHDSGAKYAILNMSAFW